MIHKCVISGCPNQSDSIIHYMLPEEPKRRSLWLKFIEDNKADAESADSSCRVCGDHFSEESFFTLDVGFSTCRILSVEAVPTINPAAETRNLEAENEHFENDTCSITISDPISLACVKDEPDEYEISANTTPGQEQNSFENEDMKYEELEQAVTDNSISDHITDSKKHHNIVTCLKCGQSFRSRRALIKHRWAHHSKKKTKPEQKVQNQTTVKPDEKFVCSQCGKGFAHHAFLKAHQKVHENAETSMPFVCHLCPKRFGYKVALAAHIKYHSSKLTCTCPVCENVFQFRGSLVQHLKAAHAGERLCCKTCKRSFLRVSGFIKHMDRHNVMTPFYCDICQIYLSQRGYAKHMLTHEKNNQTSQEDPGDDMMEPLSEEEETEAPLEDSLDSSMVEDLVEPGKEALEEQELQQDDQEDREKSE